MNVTQELLEFIVDRVNVGVFVVNRNYELELWNRFMATHSGIKPEEVVGKNLFEVFPELPHKWLQKKLDSVFQLRNFAFTSWEQRPFLFKFPHNRPITGGVEHMYQDFALMPIKAANGEVERIVITLTDATDVAIYQNMLKDANAKLEMVSRVDGLTQLYNRRHWESRFSEEFKRVKRYGGQLALIMFDLDHFKTINDTRGHLGGDEVLKAVAALIKRQVREYDIPGRYGGEEFGIVLPNTDETGAAYLAERIRAAVQNEVIPWEGQNIPVTVSLGIAGMSDAQETHSDMISQADEALYKSKRTGRNKWTKYTDI